MKPVLTDKDFPEGTTVVKPRRAQPRNEPDRVATKNYEAEKAAYDASAAKPKPAPVPHRPNEVPRPGPSHAALAARIQGARDKREAIYKARMKEREVLGTRCEQVGVVLRAHRAKLAGEVPATQEVVDVAAATNEPQAGQPSGETAGGVPVGRKDTAQNDTGGVRRSRRRKGAAGTTTAK